MFLISHKINAKSAFTTIELALYIALLSIVLILVSRIFTQALDVSQESRIVSAVERDARFIDARLRYDIARAQDVTTPVSAGASGSSLALDMGASTATYTLAAGVLYLDGVQINSHQTMIDSISFTRIQSTDGQPTVRATFTISSIEEAVAQGTKQQTFQTTYGLSGPSE